MHARPSWVYDTLFAIERWDPYYTLLLNLNSTRLPSANTLAP